MSLWPHGRRKYIWAQNRFGKFVFHRSTSCASGGGEEESAPGGKALTKVIEVQVSLGTVPQPPRLDAYLSVNTPEISRSRIVSSIKDGLVKVNGKSVRKPSHKSLLGTSYTVRFMVRDLWKLIPRTSHWRFITRTNILW